MRIAGSVLAIVAIAVLVAAAGVGEPFVPAGQKVKGKAGVAQPPLKYVAPKANGPVIVLLDEGVDPLLPLLVNDGGGETGTITKENRDVFSGVEAVRVTPSQKFASRLTGWTFRIVETPTKASEFRYLRLAWKKLGGTGVMIQLHDPTKTWALRLFAGQNSVGWQPAAGVSNKLPEDWTVVTHDLFKEVGDYRISGIALTAMDGNSALFDHIMLGRTIEGLDKATDAALGKIKPAKLPTDQERAALWIDLLGSDHVRAGSALRTFLATATDQVAFIRDQLSRIDLKQDGLEVIRKLVADLDHDDFDTRDAATEALIKIGAPAIEAVRSHAADGPSEEARYRARLILRKLGVGGTAISASAKTARIIRVLERAASKEASDLLKKMANGEYGFDAIADAKAALARLANQP